MAQKLDMLQDSQKEKKKLQNRRFLQHKTKSIAKRYSEQLKKEKRAISLVEKLARDLNRHLITEDAVQIAGKLINGKELP